MTTNISLHSSMYLFLVKWSALEGRHNIIQSPFTIQINTLQCNEQWTAVVQLDHQHNHIKATNTNCNSYLYLTLKINVCLFGHL